MRSPYPFSPKSAAKLVPGQFCSLPLGGDRIGCGRILQVSDARGTREARLVLLGIYAWAKKRLPSETDIAGVPCSAKGLVHVRDIKLISGEVLGVRPLAADKLRPGRHLYQGRRAQLMVCEGFRPIRVARKRDLDEMQVLPLWTSSDLQAVAGRHSRGLR